MDKATSFTLSTTILGDINMATLTRQMIFFVSVMHTHTERRLQLTARQDSSHSLSLLK